MDASAAIARRQSLEVDPQRELSRTIPSRALGQRGLQHTEGGTRDIHCGWRKIGVIQSIGERRFEAEMETLPKVEALGKAHVHVDHVWTLQDTQTAAAKPTGVGRGQSESTGIVELLRGLSRGWVTDAIRPRNGPAGASHDHIGVGLIETCRHRGRKPLAGLYRRHRAQSPASHNGIEVARYL